MSSAGEVDNAELISRVRAGDQAAWAVLTDRYTGLLWSVARAMRLNDQDAADAVQTTWLRLVERLDTVREPDRIAGWLATTVRRECLTLLRQRARVRVTDEWDDRPGDGAELDEALLRSERDATIWRAFRGLPERCRTLLRVLMADPPPAYTTVAAALDIPVGSIGPTRQRCLAALRRIMTGDARRSAASTETMRGEP